MVSQVSMLNRGDLERRGFGMQFQGFEFNEVDLYTHVDKGDKKRGDKFSIFRVNNRKNLNDHEGAYLARKASAGLFPWPVEECMSHTFKEINYVPDGKGGTRIERGESMKGCKWCRELPNGFEAGAALESEASADVQVEPSHTDAAEVSPAPAPATKAYLCPLCNGGADTETGFKLHMSLKHSPNRARQRDGRRKGKK